MKIALVGNPNSGKTTLFNELTGLKQYVGNWPGVTVEKKEGKIKGHDEITITDLPGIYSLSPYTLEEVISRNYLIEEKPDLIINIIDGSNIERNLYLTTQILELNIPVVLACNMMDVVEKNNIKIDFKGLEKELGVSIVPISASKNEGVDKLIDKVLSTKKSSKSLNIFKDDVLESINSIEKIIEPSTNSFSRFYAIKLFEKDEKVKEKFNNKKIDEIVKKIEYKYDDDSESLVTSLRYDYITGIISKYVVKLNENELTTSDKIDKIVTNRFLALPIFALVMGIVYYVSVTTVGTFVTDWTNEVLFGEIIPPLVENFLVSINTSDVLISLILDGIVAGVGAVLGFVPQMLVLFLFLAILEDCGYMARIAFIMDRIFRKFGLSGKSFIPMMIGTGCSVPGIMASRTIENERDRRMTIITTSFMPCGAKLPVIALIAGALFDNSGWISFSAYFVGISAIVISGIILKKTKRFSGDPAPFVMELPAYHLPRVSNVLRSVYERGSSFIKKAGSIILLSTIIIWFLSNFGFTDGSFGMVEDLNTSILARFGNIFAPLFKPLGFGDWKATVATVTGLVAKENVIGTYGVLYGVAEVSDEGLEIWSMLAQDFTPLAGYSFLLFNLLCAPCFAAIGAIKREMNNTGWTVFAVVFQTLFAYSISLIVYQIGLFITAGIFSIWTIIAIILFILYAFLLILRIIKELRISCFQLIKVLAKEFIHSILLFLNKLISVL
ncbi:MAG: ferrous iron transport protein B, partial [Erysipelotrichaceae bacterium]|nr:ferrous iron transport protein B [Erysipelotrichaceae bacterium]